MIARHREKLLPLLDTEAQPLLLLGGDEITISLPRVFEEIGLVPKLISHLQEKARARVAETRTGAQIDGARGHEQAMKAAESGHDVLKKYEQLARDLKQIRPRLSPSRRADATREMKYLESLYTSTQESGGMAIRNRDVNDPRGLDDHLKEARKLVTEGRSHD